MITNVGQVIATGQEAMRIVPQDSGLELEVYVLNRDIGFIAPVSYTHLTLPTIYSV